MFNLTLTLLCIGLGSLFLLIYKWATQNDDFFLKKGITALKPRFFFGNSAEFFMKKVYLIDYLKKLYNDFPDEKISGFFNFMTPIYLIRDPQLYKRIAITDFDSFEDHKFFIEPEMDSLLGNALFMMRGEKWRGMRTTLSPAFTGSKMRHMFEFVCEFAVDARNYLREKKLPTVGSECEMEMKDFYSRITNDVFASSAFGLKINSLIDRENELFVTGNKIQNMSSLKSFVKLWCFLAIPWLAKQLNFEFIDSNVRKVFSKLVLHKIETQRSNKIVRPDFIDVLMRTKRVGVLNVQKNADRSSDVKKNWSNEEIISQAFNLFLGGFETTMWVLTALTYELAINPPIQQRLIEEIETAIKRADGKDINFEDLNKMKYLDMVISEVLRMHSPAVVIDRACTKNILLDDGDKIKINIKKGDQIWVPIYCFHHNPKYFPNPEVFDPERFSDKNKANINPAHYTPFGIGPRACIGIRFALMEIKAIVYYMFSTFSISVSPHTEIPMKIKSLLFGSSSLNGVNLLVKRRN